MYSVCIYLGFYDALFMELEHRLHWIFGLAWLGLDGRSIGVWDRKYHYISF